MDAISLLKKHHRKAEAALKKLCRAYDADLLDRLASELAAHMVIEETIFYPTVRRVNPELILESYEEHAIAQFALKRLLATPQGDDRFEARATALLDLVRAHVEEEEGTLFPRVKRTLDRETLDLLGEEMETEHDELVARGHDAILPKQASRVTADKESERVVHSTNGFHAR
jgi:iron-sulfur cluster repair protein YtfE (RIC family)